MGFPTDALGFILKIRFDVVVRVLTLSAHFQEEKYGVLDALEDESNAKQNGGHTRYHAGGEGKENAERQGESAQDDGEEEVRRPLVSHDEDPIQTLQGVDDQNEADKESDSLHSGMGKEDQGKGGE